LRSSALTSTTRSRVSTPLAPEVEASDARLQRQRCDALVGTCGSRPDARGRHDLSLAEALGREADDEAGNPAVADEEIGADADDRQRHVGRHGLQERSQIVLVRRLEQGFGETAGPEPCDLVHLRVGRDSPAQAVEPSFQPLEELATLHADAPSGLAANSFGSA
jgi:hypothetical protein